MTDAPDPLSPFPAAPPTMPGLVPPRPSGWPTAVGVVAIVFGVLGILSNAGGVVGTLIMGAFTGLPGPGGGMMAAMQEYRGWMLLNAGVGITLAILLLFGGIGLAGRHRWSVGLLRLWAGSKFLIVPAGAAVGYLMQQAQFQAMKQDPAFASGPGSSMATGVMGTMAVAGVVIGIAWGWALPVFMFIWLSRPGIRSETAAWR